MCFRSRSARFAPASTPPVNSSVGAGWPCKRRPIMFDRCRRWRRLQARRDAGSLPLAQWGALESHLTNCPRCQAVEEADQELKQGLLQYTGMLDSPEAFDNRILTALRSSPEVPVPALLTRWGQALANCWRALPFGFLTQVAGGALVAAAVTALCLMSALRPSTQAPTAETTVSYHAAFAMENNEPPVPLDSLLQHPAPRAA